MNTKVVITGVVAALVLAVIFVGDLAKMFPDTGRLNPADADLDDIKKSVADNIGTPIDDGISNAGDRLNRFAEDSATFVSGHISDKVPKMFADAQTTGSGSGGSGGSGGGGTVPGNGRGNPLTTGNDGTPDSPPKDPDTNPPCI